MCKPSVKSCVLATYKVASSHQYAVLKQRSWVDLRVHTAQGRVYVHPFSEKLCTSHIQGSSIAVNIISTTVSWVESTSVYGVKLWSIRNN